MRDDRQVPITVEPDPPPIVRILATTLRRSAADPALRRKLENMRGVAVLKSANDPQAVTIRFSKGDVYLEHGVAADAGVVITADLTTMNDPQPPKPKVAGALGHLRFALALAKVLEPPKPDWHTAAQQFWRFAAPAPGMAAAMLVVDTTTGQRLVLGDPGAGSPEVELHGPTHALQTVLSGNSVLGEDVLGGRLRMVGRLQHLAILTGRSLAYLLDGDADGA